MNTVHEFLDKYSKEEIFQIAFSFAELTAPNGFTPIQWLDHEGKILKSNNII